MPSFVCQSFHSYKTLGCPVVDMLYLGAGTELALGLTLYLIALRHGVQTLEMVRGYRYGDCGYSD